MSLSYKRRKKAMQMAKMVDGEESLRLKMKKNPDQYPRWICGIKTNTGELLQKAFPAIGTYTGSGHGQKKVIKIRSAFPCISTIAYYRQSFK